MIIESIPKLKFMKRAFLAYESKLHEDILKLPDTDYAKESDCERFQFIENELKELNEFLTVINENI